jgi:hypothetical protein
MGNGITSTQVGVGMMGVGATALVGGGIAAYVGERHGAAPEFTPQAIGKMLDEHAAPMQEWTSDRTVTGANGVPIDVQAEFQRITQHPSVADATLATRDEHGVANLTGLGERLVAESGEAKAGVSALTKAGGIAALAGFAALTAGVFIAGD